MTNSMSVRCTILRLQALLLILALVAALSNAEAARAQQAFFTGLSLPGHSWSRGMLVSADESVVTGLSKASATSQDIHVFRWTPQTGAVDLNVRVPIIGFDMSMSRSGTSVIANRSGSGESFMPEPPLRWTAETGWVTLPNFKIAAISADGLAAVGTYYSPSLQLHVAARWTAAAGLRDLGVFPGGNKGGFVRGISANGAVVVGHHYVDGEKAYRWTPANGFSRMGLDSITNATSAASISADGSVVVGIVGRNQVAVSGEHVQSFFRWTESTGAQILPNPQGTTQTVLVGGHHVFVSDDGSTFTTTFLLEGGGSEWFRWNSAFGWQTLGPDFGGYLMSADGSVIAGDSRGEAAIWDQVNGARRVRDILDDLGLGASVSDWGRLWLEGISADGRTIVGSGLNPQGNQEAWVAYLGAPVPEPSALVLVDSALIALAGRRRRFEVRPQRRSTLP